MEAPVVLVTDKEYQRARATFSGAVAVHCVSAPADEPSLAAAIRSHGARYAVIGGVPYRDAVYDALGRGGVLARFGVGYDNIDLGRATAAGVLCTNTPGVLDQSVAELTMLMVAAAARHLPTLTGEMAAGTWRLVEGIELAGRTLTIVGSGRIGQAVGRIAAHGYGMRVIGCRRSAPAIATADPGGVFEFVTSDFALAVRAADFVSLHIPATAANTHFIDASRLALLTPRTWLINTARGAVVDERALFDALAAGRLAGAALDVFEREPYEPHDETRDLRTLPNLILTPHVGSHTIEANRQMAERALANITHADAGRFAELDLLNPQALT